MSHALSTGFDFDSDSTILALEQGETTVNVRLHSLDARLRIATYEIAIANAQSSVVSCRFCIVAADAPEIELGALEVAPGSVVRSRLAVPVSRWGDAGRVIVRVHGAGIAFMADAPPPKPLETASNTSYLMPMLVAEPTALAKRQPRSIKHVVAAEVATVQQPEAPPSLGLFFAGFLAAACVCGALEAVALARPTGVDLSAPDHVVPGLVDAPYSVHGGGSATFEATDTDGRLVASGVLPTSKGEIAFIVTPEEAGRSIRVEVTARSWFGEAAKSAQFKVAAAPKPAADSPKPTGPSAQIGTLTARRDTLDGNPTVIASYLANGLRGMVQVSDARGTLLGSAPFSNSGSTRVVLSHDDPLQPLFARLDLAGANSQAEASFEIPPEAAAPSAAPTAASAPPLIKRGGPSAAPSRNFSVEQRVVAGHYFEVRIEHVLPQMALAFQDQYGTVLDAADVVPGTPYVAFEVPASKVARMYYLVCTYGRDEGVESSILPIRAFPR